MSWVFLGKQVVSCYLSVRDFVKEQAKVISEQSVVFLDKNGAPECPGFK